MLISWLLHVLPAGWFRFILWRSGTCKWALDVVWLRAESGTVFWWHFKCVCSSMKMCLLIHASDLFTRGLLELLAASSWLKTSPNVTESGRIWSVHTWLRCVNEMNHVDEALRWCFISALTYLLYVFKSKAKVSRPELEHLFICRVSVILLFWKTQSLLPQKTFAEPVLFR